MSYQDKIKAVINEFSITPHAELFDLAEEADKELEAKETLITDQVLEILRLRAELDNLNELTKGEK